MTTVSCPGGKDVSLDPTPLIENEGRLTSRLRVSESSGLTGSFRGCGDRDQLGQLPRFLGSGC